MIKTILFDVDGTLLDTKELIINTVDYVFERLLPNNNLTYEEKVKVFIGPPLKVSFGTFFKTEEEVENAINLYKSHNREKHDELILAFPNALETLKFLKEKGIKIGIVSSKSHRAVVRGLTKTSLIEYVDVVVGCDDVVETKPSPEPIYLALDKLDAKQEETLFVGDHPHDIMAAKQAEVESCVVAYSDFLQETLTLMPDYVINDLSNLKEIF